jgi:hypothetical protein
MKQHARKLFVGLVFTGISLGVTGCQQAPAPVSAAPAAPVSAAPAQVVIEDRRPQVVEEVLPRVREEDRPRVGVEIDVHKRQDGDHVDVDLHAHP